MSSFITGIILYFNGTAVILTEFQDQEFDLAEIPLPEGSTQSQILDEFMIRQIAETLPPRAEGYPWVLIYNSEKHGFSLATLYRYDFI